jgi:hypothetical protein
MKTRLALFVFLWSSACGDFDPEDDPIHFEGSDFVDGADEGHLYRGLAVEGRWKLPAETRRIGAQQRVSYDGAPPFAGGANCAPGITPGAEMLRNRLIDYFPQVSRIGGYVCREVAGAPGVMSQHGTGRALDVFIPTIDGNADNTKGDALANWLVENAHAIGVQSVIWDRTIWRVDHSLRDYEYTGVHPHHDHVHVEITVEAARKDAPWYRDPFGPETCDPIAPMITVLSETDACFRARGPDSGWRKETTAGRGGSLLVTKAIAGDRAESWGQWTLTMKHRGEYRVEAFIDRQWGGFEKTRYQVRAGGLSYFPIIDQGRASGWTSLGVFLFEHGDGQFVRIFDNGDRPLSGDLHVVADALRVVPLHVDGCERLPSTGGVIRETSPCFHREGSRKSWRTEVGAGHGGSLIVARANDGSTPKSTAMWRILLESAGRYELSVFVDPEHAFFDRTKYKVMALGELSPLRIDQTVADGWTSLGVYDFGGGPSQYLEVVQGEQRIAIDAVRVVPAP